MTWLSGGELTSGWTSSSYPGLGILFENLPVDGENGGSPLLNDGGVAGDEVRWELLSTSGVTLIEFNEDGSFVSSGTGSFTYRSFINNVAVGDFVVTVNPLSSVSSVISGSISKPTASAEITITPAAVQATITASIPKPIAASAISIFPPDLQVSISASIAKPTASAVISIVEPGVVNSVISASIPKPTASASINVQSGPVSVTISASIPKPVASIQMFTGEPVIPLWYENIDQMIEDGRYIVIVNASRYVTLNS